MAESKRHQFYALVLALCLTLMPGTILLVMFTVNLRWPIIPALMLYGIVGTVVGRRMLQFFLTQDPRLVRIGGIVSIIIIAIGVAASVPFLVWLWLSMF
ncbi:MAG: hypothetical protein MI924_27645 [Chloroflexales bacterium]|nr:hypothetical protein [Chloroflexales bacterium]